MAIQSLGLIIILIVTLFFVKEGFGIKLEAFFALLFSSIPLLVALIFSILPQYEVPERYFPALFYLDIALINLNFFTVTLPIIKTFYWKNKNDKNQEVELKELNQETKIRLMKELVEGKDPNTNSDYVHVIMGFNESMELFKEFSRKEFSIENVKFHFIFSCFMLKIIKK
jgi:hypothetical protein